MGTSDRLGERLAKLADEWDARSRSMRETAVTEGLHPALAEGHKLANQLAKCAADLRSALTEGQREVKYLCTCDEPLDHEMCDDPRGHISCGCISKQFYADMRAREVP